MTRKLEGKWLVFLSIIAIAFSVFQLFTAGFGSLPDLQQRAVHVFFGFVLTLAVCPAFKEEKSGGRIPFYDLALFGIVAVCCLNAFLKYESYVDDIGISTPLDIILGSAMLLMCLETARRTTGWVFPILVAATIIYAMYGSYFPGSFRHPGFSYESLLQDIYQSNRGIWGYVTGISATLIAIFMIFGAFIMLSGAGQTFIDLANRIAGKMVGGPALVAVIASGLFGMISGSAAANVATVGSFTIPLMKKLGYDAEFAGGVEATASTGGQIAPPIMGVGAFIMAEMLNVSYLTVVIAAIIPALLYYLSVFMSVVFEAHRLHLPPVPPEGMVPFRKILTWGNVAPLTVSMVVLFGMMVWGYSITYSAFIACMILLIFVFFLRDFSVRNIKQRWSMFLKSMESAALGLIHIVSLAVCANIVIILVNKSGLGIKLSEAILSMAGVTSLASLVLTACIALILGMGLPTAGAYVLAAAVCAPALIALNITPIAAHMFTFYFATISAITPPVCIAVYTAATVAKADWLKIAKVALRLGIVAFIIPFIFVYQNELLMIGKWWQITLAFLTACIGVTFLASGVMGSWWGGIKVIWVIRAAWIIGGILLIDTHLYTNIAGVALLGVGYLYLTFHGSHPVELRET